MRRVILALVCVSAGCGGGGTGGDGASGGEERALSVRQALAAQPGTVVLVRGALHVDSGHVRLCTRLDDSFPPRCAGRSLRLDGLFYSGVDGLQTSPDESTHWAEEILVSGRVEAGGALRVE